MTWQRLRLMGTGQQMDGLRFPFVRLVKLSIFSFSHTIALLYQSSLMSEITNLSNQYHLTQAEDIPALLVEISLAKQAADGAVSLRHGHQAQSANASD